MSKTYELIRPRSLTDPNFEAYEYLIRWMGRDGSEYQFMFYDADFLTSVEGSVINSEEATGIQLLPAKVGRKVTVQADDLSRTDLVLFGQILENRYVTRLLKAGTIERYAPEPGSYRYRLVEGRYEITLNLVMVDIRTWK